MIASLKIFLAILVTSGFLLTTSDAYESELWDDDPIIKESYSPLPISYIDANDLPDNFSWGDIDGRSYLTKNLNQHIPQYCGSCWAHAAMSSLADRIKIDRRAAGSDINLSIQFILNCGSEVAGSCHGGSVLRTYKFIKENGFVPYDSCMPYLACSKESTYGFCEKIDTSCSALNTCRTCVPGGEHISRPVDHFPNATIAEYGIIENDVQAIQAEIFARGPVSTGLWGKSLSKYQGGIFDDVNAPREETHAVSIVGWGLDKETKQQYWIVRNSWGEYWGELGFFRILMGQNVLGIESRVVWGTPGSYTETNYPCFEDGANCKATSSKKYMDPSQDQQLVQRRLGSFKPTIEIK